jgi:hypothetical protein
MGVHGRSNFEITNFEIVVYCYSKCHSYLPFRSIGNAFKHYYPIRSVLKFLMWTHTWNCPAPDGTYRHTLGTALPQTARTETHTETQPSQSSLYPSTCSTCQTNTCYFLCSFLTERHNLQLAALNPQDSGLSVRRTDFTASGAALLCHHGVGTDCLCHLQCLSWDMARQFLSWDMARQFLSWDMARQFLSWDMARQFWSWDTVFSSCHGLWFASSCQDLWFVSSCHDLWFASSCRGVGFVSSCHRIGFVSSCHRIGFVSSCHDLWFVSSCHGVGFVSSCHGLGFVSSCHRIGFVSSCHGIGFVSSCHGIGFVSSLHSRRFICL